MEDTKQLTAKKEEDFSEWFQQLIQKAELIEYSKVSGCYILRPRAYSMWNAGKIFFNNLITKDKVEEAYFPLLIPESLFKKESEHVEGFTPEVAWVTEAGSAKLNERLAIRPTSETIMYESYAKWIRSYKDLPLRINQWCNVVRWEFKNPTPFLRSREFLWQEGHTAFAKKEEAKKEAKKILKFYKKLFEEMYAVPVIEGIKSKKEKFAGADYTLSVETFLPNGKAIQGATSHHLGQNFSKVFDIKFLDNNEKESFVYQNSWGYSTRSIGMMIMMHSDNKGLVTPPKMALNKIVIIPILIKGKEEATLKQARQLKKQLKIFAPILDDRREYSAGWKFNEWELKGVPIRIEIGPKDIENKQVVLVRRDTNNKTEIKLSNLKKEIKWQLNEIQKSLFEKAKTHLENSIAETSDYEELKKLIREKKLVLAPHCGNPECEDLIKEELEGVKTINSPLKNSKTKDRCIKCNKKSKYKIYFGKSY